MDKIFDDTDLIVRRFPCGCGWQGHSLDITVELGDEGERIVQCSINLYMAGKPSWGYRIRQALGCLRGKDGQLADFIVRPEDIPLMIETLSKAFPLHCS